MNDMHGYKDELEDWAVKYEKAVAAGVFKDAPKTHVPSMQSAVDSFFGPVDVQPKPMSDVDSKYWQDVARLSDQHPSYVVMQEIVESEKPLPANPITKDSVGMDQDSTDPKTIGATFDDDDLKQIADLKAKLHELENKQAKNPVAKSLDGFEAMKKRINALSDALALGK